MLTHLVNLSVIIVDRLHRKEKTMKKKVLLIVILLLAANIALILGQPTPGDTGLGSASGKPVGHNGGGADLDENIFLLVLSSISYMLYKLRQKMFLFYNSRFS